VAGVGRAHGVGRLDIVENCYVARKSGGCYATPGGTILLKARHAAARPRLSTTKSWGVRAARRLLLAVIGVTVILGWRRGDGDAGTGGRGRPDRPRRPGAGMRLAAAPVSRVCTPGAASGSAR